MKSTGIVKEIKDHKVTVSMYKESACSHCSKCSESNKITNEYTFYTDEKLFIGDIITFEMEDKRVLKAAIIVYLIPVIALFLGYFLGSKLGLSEGQSIGTSFFGMIVSFLGIYIYDKKVVKNQMEQNVEIISIERADKNEK
nr:SoxR reducing system RseC family protein [uncultured Cetobacterium sp.]